MKFYAIPVRDNGRDQIGTFGVISGEYQSVQNFLRYNRKHMNDDVLYSVYIKTGYISSGDSKDWKFQGFHSDLAFDEHMRRAKVAIDAENR